MHKWTAKSISQCGFGLDRRMSLLCTLPQPKDSEIFLWMKARGVLSVSIQWMWPWSPKDKTVICAGIVRLLLDPNLTFVTITFLHSLFKKEPFAAKPDLSSGERAECWGTEMFSWYGSGGCNVLQPTNLHKVDPWVVNGRTIFDSEWWRDL